jgi:simple sugar transport system permease protein
VTILLELLSLTMLAQTLRTAVPYACAALGGVWSERSGVINIALEGLLLASGLASVIVEHATHSAWWGLLAGVVTGAVLGALHAVIVVHGRIDAIVSGIALNVIAAGGTRFLMRAIYDSSSNSPGIEGFRFKYFNGPSGSMLLVRTFLDPLTLLTLLAMLVTLYMLIATRFGLRVRAAGEDPVAAATVGIPVARLRVLAVMLGGGICGLGGVALAFDQHQFQSGMSGGRGFIALATVILSGWRPVRAVLACLVFAALDALQFVLQGQAAVPHDLVQMLPYVVTLVALGAVGRRGSASSFGRAPAGLGKAAP